MSNDDNTTIPPSYWLCSRKAEPKVFMDFGNILHLCKRCCGIYYPLRSLKVEDI
jgi:uncharacterized membrane protein